MDLVMAAAVVGAGVNGVVRSLGTMLDVIMDAVVVGAATALDDVGKTVSRRIQAGSGTAAENQGSKKIFLLSARS